MWSPVLPIRALLTALAQQLAWNCYLGHTNKSTRKRMFRARISLSLHFIYAVYEEISYVLLSGLPEVVRYLPSNAATNTVS